MQMVQFSTKPTTSLSHLHVSLELAGTRTKCASTIGTLSQIHSWACHFDSVTEHLYCH